MWRAGAQWLSLTRGTDITELVETHHLDSERIQRLLPLYAVAQEEGAPPLKPRRSPFTFEHDGFYCSLRRKIWAAHGGKARESGESRVAALGPSAASKAFADVFAVLSVVLTVAAGRAKSSRMAALGAVVAGVFNGTFIGIGHNFLHQKDSFRRHYQDISGFSSAEFRMHHALSHHPYTNTVMDAEINSTQPAVDFFPGEASLARRLRGRVLLSVACCFGIPMKQLTRFGQILSGKWDGETADVLAQLIPVGQLALLSSLQGSAKGGAALWALMLTSTSNLFLWGNFLTGPHFNDECWHQGDTLDSRDWGLLQIQTNTERSELSQADNTRANLFNIPTFGLHHLHHLFPTIDAHELSKLVPVPPPPLLPAR